MHANRLKEYWKFLNSLKNKTSNKQPHPNEFYENFKQINEINRDSAEEADTENVPNDPFENETLNCEITAPEILKCIRNLKDAKSPGSDDVLNEYMKCTSHLLMPLYTLLFNVILETELRHQNGLKALSSLLSRIKATLSQ